jgi:hypothetical protein
VAGVPGRGGPPPKREDQRRRSNPPTKGPPQKAAAGERTPAPPASRAWHPIARRWYVSLAKSGQAQFYESSDWSLAYLITEALSRELHEPAPLKAATLMAWLKACTVLLATEGDRRRMALELEVQPATTEEAASVPDINTWRTRVDSTG